MAEETNPLEELLVDELKDLYSAENQIVKALPKMAKNASHEATRTPKRQRTANATAAARSATMRTKACVAGDGVPAKDGCLRTSRAAASRQASPKVPRE